MLLQMRDFRPYYSQVYAVGAMVVDKSFEFNNELGEGHYKVNPGDIILEGTVGEHWPVPASKLIGDKAKYEIDGHPINLGEIAKGHSLDADFTKITTKESKAITWAAQVKGDNITVTSPEGTVLTANSTKEGVSHGNGDFICCADSDGKPNFEWGVWPVNGNVFENTYKLADIEYDLEFHAADDILNNDSYVPQQDAKEDANLSKGNHENIEHDDDCL